MVILSSPSGPPRTEAAQIEHLTKELQRAELLIRLPEERWRLHLTEKYGPKSEKLNDAQLQLLELEPGVSAAEVEAGSLRDPLPPASPATSKDRKKRRHPGRQEFPADMPRVEKVIPCTPEQCACRTCGKESVVIGCEQSEQLDVEPVRYFVLVTRREKRACRSCAEGVNTAPLPARIIDKGW
jgi:transposase